MVSLTGNNDRVIVQGSWSSTLQELDGNSSRDGIRSPSDVQNITNLDDLTIGWYRDSIEASSLGKDRGDGSQDGDGNKLVTHFDIKILRKRMKKFKEWTVSKIQTINLREGEEGKKKGSFFFFFFLIIILVLVSA